MLKQITALPFRMSGYLFQDKLWPVIVAACLLLGIADLFHNGLHLVPFGFHIRHQFKLCTGAV